ncbi:hypothetical protein ACWOE3_11775 [Enterococcus dispar]|uniref:Uncharacterized protein n=1 Tax=Enterococcus dispar ATCC 51266 TaxID=1139219 RepID=S0KR16_9ENTE|nr:hypothetical protein [Enterococcus dispar]EOT42578.1 hypothetical protein OMK_00938 [Enterococcus dispar ATCC 51266]EOW84971.1 hypothetical protein I569_00261 [Enterococcus dispar ATCC 51266]OJG38064.1 hypothetical protein RV01_GL000607 [Enterococcus dispar]WCG33464.1 hypothetical protein PML78_01900 [Enterococcus dispar]
MKVKEYKIGRGKFIMTLKTEWIPKDKRDYKVLIAWLVFLEFIVWMLIGK